MGLTMWVKGIPGIIIEFSVIKIHLWNTEIVTETVEERVHKVVAFLLIISHQPVQSRNMEQGVRQTS